MPISYSPLRYPGGKTKLYDYVLKIIKFNGLEGETYIEPFAGGAGLAIKLLLKNNVKRIVINDYDPAIYSFWQSVLYHTDEFCNMIDNIDISIEQWDNQRNIYIKPQGYSVLEYGFATFFLNRTNVSGIINGGIIGGKSQDGEYKIDARFNRDTLIKKIKAIAEYKDEIHIYNLDAKELLKSQYLNKYRKVLINFDPPYVKKGEQLYKNSFTQLDHELLAKEIYRCKRKWIVTYDVCTLVSTLYKKYRRSIIDINYSANTNRIAQEYVFFSHNLELPIDIEKMCIAVGENY